VEQKGDGFYKAVGLQGKNGIGFRGTTRMAKRRWFLQGGRYGGKGDVQHMWITEAPQKKMLSRFGKTEETEVRATFQGSTKTGCCPFCGEAEEVNKGTRMFGGSRWLLRNCGLSVDIRTCGEYWSTG